MGSQKLKVRRPNGVQIPKNVGNSRKEFLHNETMNIVFQAIAVVADLGEKFITPCGACRQSLAEFGLDIEVYLARPDGAYIKTKVQTLLPDSFTPEQASKH